MRTIPPGKPVKTRMETRRGIDEVVPVMMVMTRVRLRASSQQPARRSSRLLARRSCSYFCEVRSAQRMDHGCKAIIRHWNWYAWLLAAAPRVARCPPLAHRPPVFLLNKTQNQNLVQAKPSSLSLFTLLSCSLQPYTIYDSQTPHSAYYSQYTSHFERAEDAACFFFFQCR